MRSYGTVIPRFWAWKDPGDIRKEKCDVYVLLTLCDKLMVWSLQGKRGSGRGRKNRPERVVRKV